MLASDIWGLTSDETYWAEYVKLGHSTSDRTIAISIELSYCNIDRTIAIAIGDRTIAIAIA